MEFASSVSWALSCEVGEINVLSSVSSMMLEGDDEEVRMVGSA